MKIVKCWECPQREGEECGVDGHEVYCGDNCIFITEESKGEI